MPVVIIIDSDESVVRSLREILLGASMELLWAPDGRTGALLAERFPSATVLVGDNLPAGEQSAVAHRIKLHNPCQSVCRYTGAAGGAGGELTANVFDVELSLDAPISEISCILQALDIRSVTRAVRRRMSQVAEQYEVANNH